MKARKLIAMATLALGVLGAGGAAHAKPQLCVSIRTPNHVPAPDGVSIPDLSLPQADLGQQCQDLP